MVHRGVPPRKLLYPLKVDGWKMKCPFKIFLNGLFSGNMLVFRDVSIWTYSYWGMGTLKKRHAFASICFCRDLCLGSGSVLVFGSCNSSLNYFHSLILLAYNFTSKAIVFCYLNVWYINVYYQLPYRQAGRHTCSHPADLYLSFSCWSSRRASQRHDTMTRLPVVRCA